MSSTRLSARYAAFVSYRHAPAEIRWAKRIAQELERFRTPRHMLRHGYPGRLGAVFRDEAELHAGQELSETLQEALARSSALIVVCSSRTGESEWVQREIRHFQELGRGDRIYALLIDGDEETAIPEAMRRRLVTRTKPDGTVEVKTEAVQLLAADVRPRLDEDVAVTERRAVLSIIAALLGCSYDDLAQRERRRRQRAARVPMVAGALTFFGLVVAGGLIWNSYFRVTSQYCAQIAENWGVPSCVSDVGSDYAERERSYRIRRRGGRVIELAHVNGLDQVIDLANVLDPDPRGTNEGHSSETARWTYAYTQDGLLESTQSFSEGGSPVMRTLYRFSDDRMEAAARFEQDIGIASMQAGDVGDSRKGRSQIGQHRLTFDDQGRVTRRMFEKLGGGMLARDASGAYGTAFVYGPGDLIVERRRLDADGAAFVSKTGVAAYRYRYDEHRQAIIRTESVDERGVLVENAVGYAIEKNALDELGRVVETTLWSKDNEPVLHQGTGQHRWTSDFDDHGYRFRDRLFGLEGEPVAHRKAAWAVREHVADAWGRSAEIRYFGVDGERVVAKNLGCWRQTVVRDESGNIVQRSYFDVNDAPTGVKDSGYAVLKMELDENGRSTQEWYLGADGMPFATQRWGAPGLRMDRDKLGRVTNYTWVDADGSPTLNRYGYASERDTHDARGNITSEAFFDAEGKPTLEASSGVHRFAYEHDEYGNVVRKAFEGTNRRPTVHRDTGVAEHRFAYDDLGNLVQTLNFDVEGQPTLNLRGAHEIRSAYDKRGNEVRTEVFGIDGKRVLDKGTGVSYQRDTFNDRGHRIRRQFFGPEGEPMLIGQGYAEERIERDERGNWTSRSFFGLNGEPVVNRQFGGSRFEWTYNDNDQQVEYRSYDVGGGPAERAWCGVPVVRYEYNRIGQQTHTRLFDLDGNPATCAKLGHHATRFARDAFDNIVEEATLDENDELIADPFGVAITRKDHDRYSNTIRIAYFDEDGAPVVHKKYENAVVEYDFGPNSKIAEVRKFGLDGSLVDSETDCPIERREYDPRGRLTLEACYGADDTPLIDPDSGVHRRTVTYESNHLEFEELFDDSGEPVRGKGEWAAMKMRTFRDERGHIRRQETLDGDGKLAKNNLGFAVALAVRDPVGRLVEESYLDEEEKPGGRAARVSQAEEIEDPFGDFRMAVIRGVLDDAQIAKVGKNTIYRVTQTFDVRGNVVERAFYGPEGEPVSGFNGFTAEKTVYDKTDHPVRYIPFVDGEESNVHVRLDYNEAGEVVRVTYVDVEDTPVEGRGGIAGYDLEWDALGEMKEMTELAIGQVIAAF